MAGVCFTCLHRLPAGKVAVEQLGSGLNVENLHANKVWVHVFQAYKKIENLVEKYH